MADTVKHTPGEWRSDKVNAKAGLAYAPVMANTLIAKVYSTNFGDHAQAEANARLMAAAPDLHDGGRKLAADVGGLRAFEHEIRAAIGNTNWSVLMDRLVGMDAAIAKAEGRAQ